MNDTIHIELKRISTALSETYPTAVNLVLVINPTLKSFELIKVDPSGPEVVEFGHYREN